MTISELLAALATKLGALGVAAKLALGLGLATAMAATAGAAGVLPTPAQHAVASVVNATPLHIPDPSDDHNAPPTVGGAGDTVAPVVGDTTGTGDEGTDTGTDQGTTPSDAHGACVSAVAKSAPTGAGGVHGQAVSDAAKTCPKTTGAGDEVTTTTTTTVDDGGAQGAVTPEIEGAQGHGQSAADHGQSAADHGQSGQVHGQSGQDHGSSGQHGR
ncbi:MAG TPA: hypothetical protein VHS52_01280 [Acidimicrobiales bacterium]|nr:hypothetical protein [Acidimicrobiales bacterium]